MTFAASALPPLMTPDQVAEVVGVNTATVYRWIHSGYLGAAKIGRGLRVPSSEIARLLREGSEQAAGIEVRGG